jgi:hypothetical protein
MDESERPRSADSIVAGNFIRRFRVSGIRIVCSSDFPYTNMPLCTA